LRLIDSYINLTGHHTFSINKSDRILNIPASRFLRPYSKKLNLFEPLRLSRIKNSLTYAAKNNQAYHLWWHPHNFGVNLEQNLQFLEEILKHFKKLSSEYGMRSKNMSEIAEEILKAYAL
jgi:hypothetical protein